MAECAEWSTEEEEEEEEESRGIIQLEGHESRERCHSRRDTVADEAVVSSQCTCYILNPKPK